MDREGREARGAGRGAEIRDRLWDLGFGLWAYGEYTVMENAGEIHDRKERRNRMESNWG